MTDELQPEDPVSNNEVGIVLSRLGKALMLIDADDHEGAADELGEVEHWCCVMRHQLNELGRTDD